MTASRDPQRILAIKLADLGDLLLCEPAFRSLRIAFPNARIDVLTTPASTALLNLFGHGLRAVPFPKHLFDNPKALVNPTSQYRALKLALKLRTARYDRVVVFHHLTTAFGAIKFSGLVRATGSRHVAGLDNGRGTFLTHRVADKGFGAQHESAYMCDVAVAAGGAAVEPAPIISLTGITNASTPLPDRFAAIFPVTGPFSRAREWPTSRYGAVAADLQHRGIRPVIVGGVDARVAAGIIRAAEPSAIDLAGRTSLPELAAVVRRATLVVGGDSFIGHLAAAVGTPVVAIFGPSNADAWRPAGAVDAGVPTTAVNRSIVVRHDLPCEPCIYTGFRLGRPNGCPDRTCLQLVTTHDVADAVSHVLGVA